MYKKLHIPEKEPWEFPLIVRQGFFFVCILERVIMLTKYVYLIHPKNRKKPISFQSKKVGFFCSIAVRILADASRRLM